MNSFEPVSVQRMVELNGRHNYGCLFIADLWPKEITDRTRIEFNHGCDDLDWNDSACLAGNIDGMLVPVVIVRYRGYPARSTSVDIPLDYLAKGIHTGSIAAAVQEYLKIQDQEVSWRTGDKVPYLTGM